MQKRRAAADTARKKRNKILKKVVLYAVITIIFTLSLNAATISVLLADNLESVTLNSVTGMKLHEGQAYMPLIPKETDLIIKPVLGTISYYFDDVTVNNVSSNIVFAPMTEGVKAGSSPLIKVDITPAKKYNNYRGEMEIHINASGKLMLVNRIDLDEYLYSVLAAEMGSSQPAEALKSQAVAARSYAAVRLGRYVKQKFDVYDTVQSQVYYGYDYEKPTTVQAVKDTLGEVMYDSKGKLVDAMFFSTCGGFTETASNGATYLVSVNDCGQMRPKTEEEWHAFYSNKYDGNCHHPGTSFASNFRWIKTFTFDEINKIFSEIKTTGNITEIAVLKREPGGRVSSLKVVGETGTVILSGESKVRSAFGGLKSAGISVKKNENDFTFYGGGYGHGQGMCQVGVIGQAKKGRLYKDILKFYYQGTEISQIK